eukprot:752936-Hanusia_phi.AAC.3
MEEAGPDKMPVYTGGTAYDYAMVRGRKRQGGDDEALADPPPPPLLPFSLLLLPISSYTSSSPSPPSSPLNHSASFPSSTFPRPHLRDRLI